ncbi:MFS transporter [Streptomyces sp. NPDC059063]|uniref:MFS transporter n=1 Tax=unclassified Streptomyces TaxID=2593676 RepID=UPI0036A61B20
MTPAWAGRIPGLSPSPVRPVYLATLVANIGSGAWYTCLAIFAVHSVGVSPTQFGVGVTAAGVAGLLAGSPLGYLADRTGAREMLIGISLAQAAAALGYLLTRGFWPFVLVTCFAVAGERAAPGIRIALISGLTEDKERLSAISTTVVVAHIGAAVGAALGALVLWADNRAAYVALILLSSVSFLAFALIVRAVPHVETLSEKEVTRPVLVLRDRPFLVITALSAVLALNWGMMGSGVPLWITEHTSAPAWTMGVLTTVNAVAIVVFQNRASRGATTVPGAARLGVWCAAALVLSCLLFAATFHGSGPWVIVLLLAGAAAHVVGELLYVASAWGLSVGLAPDDAHGEYQGAFGTGPAAALMFAPALMSLLVVDVGVAGWFVLAGLFLLGGLPTVRVSRWAQRNRPDPASTGGPAPDQKDQKEKRTS